MRVRFWGVRGSVPWATPKSIGHGCNTPCVEVRDDESGAFLVLDAGSGIVGLGGALGDSPRDVPILLTHYHWDHLQGLPFFAPFFAPRWSPTIWAPVVQNVDLAWVDTIFLSPFFPVPMERLASRPAVALLPGRDVTIGGFRVTAQPLTHPGGAFAYRVHGAKGDLVYATDHEFGDGAVDDALADFARGAAAVILDAHFTPEELPNHKGWGHGSWDLCIDFAERTGARHVWLFHHKPGRTDEELAEIERVARERFPAIDAAGEGDTFTI